MRIDSTHLLQAANRAIPQPGLHAPVLLIAGATGAIGNEVMRRLVGGQRHARAHVLAREPIRTGLRGVTADVLPGLPIAQWPPVPADVGLVMFDPPRLYHDRERALWTPVPEDLLALAAWMRGCGVRTLAIVLPHAQGRLPEALKRGLASLDEHEVAALGFERLLLVRSAVKPAAAGGGGLLRGTARFMLSTLRFMVPASEQPVRASKVAELVDVALRLAPPGIHVCAPHTVWQAAQGDLHGVVQRWLAP